MVAVWAQTLLWAQCRMALFLSRSWANCEVVHSSIKPPHRTEIPSSSARLFLQHFAQGNESVLMACGRVFIECFVV